MFSCIIAAHYDGGIAVAADRRVLRGARYSEEKKLHVIRKGTLAIAFSGRTGIADDFMRLLKGRLTFTGARTIYEALEPMKDVVADISLSYLRRRTFEPDDVKFEVFICGLDRLDDGRPELFRLDHLGYCERIPRPGESDVPYVVGGHAKDLGQAFMKIFYREDVTRERIVEILSLIVVMAETIDSSVGGLPHVIFCEPKAKPIELSDTRINTILKKTQTTTAALSEFHKRIFGTEKAAAEILRLVFHDENAYKVFKETFVEEYIGVSTNDREFYIELKLYEELGPRLVEGRTTSTYIAFNRSTSTIRLFYGERKQNLIAFGNVTIPSSLTKSQFPENPRALWDLNREKLKTGFQIDEEDVEPILNVTWRDPSDLSRGISYKLESGKLIAPGDKKKVTIASRCLYDNNDYIVRRFNSYGENVRVSIKKPTEIEVYVAWLLPRRGNSDLGPRISSPIITHHTYSQEVKGITLPGNGFVVMWWPTRRNEKKEEK